MMESRQKKIVPYDLYITKKYKNGGDHLTDVINRKIKQRSLQLEACDNQIIQQAIRKQMNEKRLGHIRKQYCNRNHNHKLSNPQPFIKRTWVSPLISEKTGEKSNYNSLIKNMYVFTKNKQRQSLSQQKQQISKICKQLYINKKIHLFGDYMYSDFDQNQTSKKSDKQNYEYISTTKSVKSRQKVLQLMHKQYQKLQKSEKSMVVCNSTYKKHKFYNPLNDDKYFKQIMNKNDSDLNEILIGALSGFSTFTFSSFIKFYDIFVWQQANKTAQIEFVLRLLMRSANQITYSKLNTCIDFFCQKIKLPGTTHTLQGFNSVMKKLILGEYYSKQENQIVTINRQILKYNLQQNEECISILINVFYSQ